VPVKSKSNFQLLEESPPVIFLAFMGNVGPTLVSLSKDDSLFNFIIISGLFGREIQFMSFWAINRPLDLADAD
jgi:hypothetical protein